MSYPYLKSHSVIVLYLSHTENEIGKTGGLTYKRTKLGDISESKLGDISESKLGDISESKRFRIFNFLCAF